MTFQRLYVVYFYLLWLFLVFVFYVITVFVFGCTGSLLLHTNFLWVQTAGTPVAACGPLTEWLLLQSQAPGCLGSGSRGAWV